ncbi:43448_t:CDS:2 [Gigaspora margarita]|uniref:43448_t:CDS:1 n=1 Tax=Gigaspora margarita TaxID=4874 RepID=A0ABN7UKW9_GIGMA|nr:43448_t:CDS:2 [Gigaspora margarita]
MFNFMIIQLVGTIKNRSIKMGLLEMLIELMNDEFDQVFIAGVDFDDNEIFLGKNLKIIVLHNIFTDIPQRIRSIPDDAEPVIADIVFKEKIFVSNCHSHSLVPNVILPLFTSHQSFHEPWQILICRSTTTSEEIALFIKRSFISAKNGYKDFYFALPMSNS